MEKAIEAPAGIEEWIVEIMDNTRHKVKKLRIVVPSGGELFREVTDLGGDIVNEGAKASVNLIQNMLKSVGGVYQQIFHKHSK